MDYIRELRALVGHRPLIVVSAAVLVRDDAGRVLLQRRTDGYWGLLGGAMHPGETLEETARREVREETTLALGPLTLVDLCSGEEFFHRYPNGDETYLVMPVYETRHPDGTAIPDGTEGLELRFFALHDLPERMLPVAARALDRYRRRGGAVAHPTAVPARGS